VSGVGLSELPLCRQGGGRAGGEEKKFLEGMDPATADPKLLLAGLCELAEQREHVLMTRAEFWLRGLFPAELDAHNAQGRADQTWLFGRPGRWGLVQQVLDHQGEAGLCAVIGLAQEVYFKARDEENPLRTPMAYLVGKIKERLAGYQPAAEQLPPDKLAGLPPATAKQTGLLLFRDGIDKIFGQEQGLELTAGDGTTFNKIYESAWQQVGQAGIWQRIYELLQLAKASGGKRKPAAYFTAEAKRRWPAAATEAHP